MDAVDSTEPLNSSPVENLNESFSVPKLKESQQSEYAGKILWRIANVMMTGFFAMASGVQFNDPDPFLWVPLYGTAALLSACISIQPNTSASKLWRSVYWLHTVYCIGMFLYVLVELIIVATNPQADGSLNPLTYEEGREMAGIMITIIWLFTCMQSPIISYDPLSKHQMKKSVFVLSVVLISIFPLFLWYLCYSSSLSSGCTSFCSDFYVNEFSF
ncbi:hypothetical protein JTE90_012141 [Oedothorax gibbosus]|uniref:Transmembrane protein 220 n=1 Tax=Oedothorax gibbosus TaxID=931172 RepID=A0AAV6U734_9ARAC|nr:hypothetical protein JTE90_012141 [Oedothorax gibbosus]